MILPKDITSKFTEHARNIINLADEREKKVEKITLLDWLVLIMREEGSLGAHILKNFKITKESVEEAAAVNFQQNGKPEEGEFIPLEEIIVKSALIAKEQKSGYIGTEHFLYAILNMKSRLLDDFFSAKKINAEDIRRGTKSILDNANKFPDAAKILNIIMNQKNDFPAGGMMVPGMMPDQKVTEENQISPLEFFCTDLTREAAKKKIGPIIGREKELKRMINILNRKTKNNPVLIGEPGVGKTAIVEALAIRINEGRVPSNLLSKRVLMLDMGSLIAGSMFRGEFESRLKDILREIGKDDKTILFIDEVHTIVGAGSAAGSLDAANILKPALTGRRLQCIGATTLAEYRKYFSKDAALERRFQPIAVEEPSAQETIKMLAGLKKSFENYHRVAITSDAIEAAVNLSVRFVPERFLPDKAIDLLDEAASYLVNFDSDESQWVALKELLQEKNRIIISKDKAVESEKYEEALLLKKEEDALDQKIKKIKTEARKAEGQKKTKILDAKIISKIATDIIGVPKENMTEYETKKIKNLEKVLNSKVIGQDKAVSMLVKVIKRHRANISNPNRPIGSFIFIGPTGVGKTELVKVLAEELFGSQKNLIKIDMSEFMERHNVSRLLGAPPGYVGFEEGGKLTEQVRLKPYSVILFDEIEKAHPEVVNILLQILEDGVLSDAQGRKINFKNTIIILTSNLGSEEFTSSASALGFSGAEGDKKLHERFEAIKNKTLAALKEKFKPELLNRIDEVIVFEALDLEHLEKITALRCKEFASRLKNNKISIAKAAIKKIAKTSLNPAYGARLVRKNIQNLIEDPIAEKIINGEIKEGDKIYVEAGKDGKIEMKVER